MKNQINFRSSASGNKCDRDKPIFSAERGSQSDCVEVQNRDLIGSKIPKTGVITAEPPYNAQIWEYPPSPHGGYLESWVIIDLAIDNKNQRYQ